MAETKRQAHGAGPEPVTLRAIDAELRAIGDALAEAGGVLTPEVEEMLEELQAERDAKVEGIAALYRAMKGHEAVAKAEEDHYARLRSMWGNSAERLKEYLHRFMRQGAAPIHRVKTGRVHAYRQRNSRPTFAVADPRALPDELRVDPAPPDPRLRDDAALELWRTEFDRIVEARTALMRKDERTAWVLENLQELAQEAGRRALPEGIAVTLEEHLRL